MAKKKRICPVTGNRCDLHGPSCREQEEKPPQPGHGHGAKGAEVEDSANMKHANAWLRQHEMCIDDYSDYTK